MNGNNENIQNNVKKNEIFQNSIYGHMLCQSMLFQEYKKEKLTYVL